MIPECVESGWCQRIPFALFRTLSMVIGGGGGVW